MRATIRRWGNSAAVRLNRKELDRMGLHEGDNVEIIVRPGKAEEWDISQIPVFRSTDGLTFKQAREQALARNWEARHARR